MATRRPRRDVFGYTLVLRLVILAAAAIFVLGFVSEYRDPPPERSPLVLYGFLAMSVLAIIGVAETFRVRIELRDDEIRVARLIGHQSYPRSAVVSAKWEKGCAVALKLRDGSWVTLPDTGHANTKVAGAIRAWLNE